MSRRGLSLCAMYELGQAILGFGNRIGVVGHDKSFLEMAIYMAILSTYPPKYKVPHRLTVVNF